MVTEVVFFLRYIFFRIPHNKLEGKKKRKEKKNFTQKATKNLLLNYCVTLRKYNDCILI